MGMVANGWGKDEVCWRIGRHSQYVMLQSIRVVVKSEVIVIN